MQKNETIVLKWNIDTDMSKMEAIGTMLKETSKASSEGKFRFEDVPEFKN